MYFDNLCLDQSKMMHWTWLYTFLVGCCTINQISGSEFLLSSRSKRQVGAPVFSQSSYSFFPTTCTASALIGTVSATATSGTPTYGVFSNGQYAINANTGALSYATAATSTQAQTVIITATSSATSLTSTTTVTVTPLCSIGNTGAAPVFSQSSYSFFPSICTAGALVGTVSATATSGTPTYGILSTGQYAINANTGALSYLTAATTSQAQTVIVTATSPASTLTSTTTVTVTPLCSIGTTTGTISFSQSSYTFVATSCTAGSSVGQVSISNAPSGTVTYFLSGAAGAYTINPVTGSIATTQNIPVGTSSLNVAAVTSTGQSATTVVSVSATCTTSGGSTTNTGTSSTNIVTGRTGPVFAQSSYSCTTACSNFVQSVCVILATNTRSDPLNYALPDSANRFFIDPSSGEIRTIAPLVTSAGTYQLTASASDPFGTLTTVPVTITVSGTSCSFG